MTTVQEIEKSITFLPKPDLSKFRSWFEKFDANAWDNQFEQDAKSGKLDHLADEALRDLADGRCSTL
jgi:hypothetical protein